MSNRDKNTAIREFDLMLTAGSNEEVVAQVQSLAKEGITVRAGTDAVLLGGSCGFVGCGSTYLVATAFHTQGANPETTVIAAVVEIDPARHQARVRRILSREEVKHLQQG
jgi:hypothetical protein